MSKSSKEPDQADVFTDGYRFLFHHANDRVKEFKEALEVIKKENRELNATQRELMLENCKLRALPGGDLVQKNKELRQENEVLKLRIDGLKFLAEGALNG